jgi:hypothetical protein
MVMKEITARQAFNQGLKRYFTNQPCKYGHISERMISNGSCVNCLKNRRNRDRKKIYENLKEWRKNNPQSRTQEARRYRAKYPEKVKANQKAYRERNADQIREKDKLNQRRLRALNPEKEKLRLKRFREKRESERLIEAGKPKPEFCPLCKNKKYRIVFDHCHTSGKFRGWICDQCNKVLGLVKDSTIILKEMILYLEDSNVKNNDRS